jgi:hypothetical protein
MRSAKDFLTKFNNLTPPNDAVRRVVAEAVKSIAGVPVAKTDVTLSRGIAFVSCSSIAKSAIRAARASILDEIYNHMPKARETVRDIR